MKYGSVCNGLAVKNASDLDLTLLCENDEVSHELLLTRIKNILSKQSRYLLKDDGPIKIKSGWILMFRDTILNIDVDLTINKKAELLNSMLIFEYVLCD